jgi:hypothetical protein
MSTAGTLAENRYLCKRNAANQVLRHRCPMGKTRKRREPKPPATPVHALFVRRVREEMKARGLNPLKLEEYGIKQRTLADVLRGADPRLSTIYAAARALGMNTADLLREGPDKRVNTVTNLHPPRTPMIPPAETSAADRKEHRR